MGSDSGARSRPEALDASELSCVICHDLLLEPVVAACGHDFCRLCYSAWTAKQQSCPMCRQPLPRDVPGVCKRMETVIDKLFPGQLEQRRAEAAVRALVEEEHRGTGGLLDAIAELHRSLAQLIVDIRRDSSGVARARAVLEAHIRGPHRRDRTLLELARAVANADRLAVVRGSAQAGAAAGAVQGAAQDGVPLPEAGSAAGAAQRAVVGTPPFLEGFIPPSGWLGPSREELRWAHYSDPERFVPPNGWLGPSPEELRWAHYRDGGEPGASRGHVSAGVGLLGTGGARLGRGLPPLPGLAFTMGTRRGAERQSQRGGGACRPARSTRAAARPARPCGRSRAWPWRSMGRLPMGGRASASRV